MHVRLRRIATAAVTTAAMVMLPKAVSAQKSYQFELEGGYSWSKTDTSPSLTQSQIPFRGTYHFEPVSLKGHPWNEAAFLEHSMDASVELTWFKFDVGGGAGSADGLLYGAGFTYASKDQPVAGQISFRTGNVDGSGLDIDITSFNVAAGYWFKDNAIGGLRFERDELDPGGSTKFTHTNVSAFGKMVKKLDDEQFVNAEAHLGWTSVDTGTTDDNFEIGVRGDYYFTPQYSAGATLDLSFGDAVSDKGTTVGVQGSAWFTPQVGARVEYSRFLASDSAGDDMDNFGIFVSVRF